MRREMIGTITAQKEDDVSAAKLRNDVQSMNRDWSAFYDPLFGQDRQKYANVAAQRIEREEQDKARKKVTEDYERRKEKEEKERKADRKVADEVYQSRRSSVGEDQQADDGRSSMASVQDSPHLTDCTESSEITVKLDVGKQDVKEPRILGLFCLNVNMPGGCLNRSRRGYESYGNEGKHCRDGDRCTRGGKCAFVHASSSSTRPSHSTGSRLNGWGRQVDLRTRDLRPMLEQVLEDLLTYKPCNFVNKYRGCKPKQSAVCRFNHTLEGIVCEDFKRGRCPRGHMCPLLHAGKNTSAAVPSPYMGRQQPNDGGNTCVSKERLGPPLLVSQQQSFGSYPTQQDALGLGVELGGQQPYEPPTQTMNTHLHPNTPKGPGSHYVQPPGPYTPLLDRGGSSSRACSNELWDRKRRHDELDDLDQDLVKRAAPLKHRITRDPVHYGARNGGLEIDYSDDPEDDGDTSHETWNPRKRQKDRRWN